LFILECDAPSEAEEERKKPTDEWLCQGRGKRGVTLWKRGQNVTVVVIIVEEV
jgi:hypothetical protein